MEEFAVALGWSWSTVGRYERGTRMPSVHALDHIARTLGVKTEQLLMDEEVAA